MHTFRIGIPIIAIPYLADKERGYFKGFLKGVSILRVVGMRNAMVMLLLHFVLRSFSLDFENE